MGYWEIFGVKQGEHVAHVAWLPEEATDICFYKSQGFTAAEFRISEGGTFVKWCQGKGFCALFADWEGAV